MGRRFHQNPILKTRAARLQDLRCDRAAGGSNEDLAVTSSLAEAGVRTVAPGFNRGSWMRANLVSPF